MSGVDVRQWLGDERFMYGLGTESRAKCDEAYSAVCELIEAFERMILTGIDERTHYEYMSQRDHYARAALRRVKGESE